MWPYWNTLHRLELFLMSCPALGTRCIWQYHMSFALLCQDNENRQFVWSRLQLVPYLHVDPQE
jgi:hypothetical protein